MNRLLAILLAPIFAIGYAIFVAAWFVEGNRDDYVEDFPEADEELTEAEKELGYTNNGY